jgi:23S rRNA pseudouridine955/2504/2580 synthase/23S rRNA pseudouridine1911/1915/1917 synthase
MAPAKNKLSVIFENDDFIALDKPSGMLSIPDRAMSEPSLKDMLDAKYGKIFPVHRLDRDTSGIILFAKNAEFHKYLSGLFEKHKVKKYYMGVVTGKPYPEQGEIEAPIAEHPVKKGLMVVHRSGKPSHTTYEVLRSHTAFSLVSFQLHTGRTHQIRVHAKHIGHPIACDPLYGTADPILLSKYKKGFKQSKYQDERPILNRLALHAYRLVFDDQGVIRDLQAPTPKEFEVLMTQLEKG